MKFRKRLVYIEAVRWWRHGDHAKVTPLGEIPGAKRSQLSKYGWLETAQGGHQIAPGDWIVEHSNGLISSCNPQSFDRLYEPAEPFVDLPRTRRRDETY